MIEAIGGRKVLIVAGAVLLGIGLVVVKGDVPQNFLTLLQYAVGLFMAGNAVEHTARAYAGASDTAPEAAPVTVDTAEIAKAVSDALSKDLKPVIQGVANQNAVLAQIIGDVAKGTTFLTQYVAGVQGSRPSA